MALRLISNTKDQAPETVADVDKRLAAAMQEIRNIHQRLEVIKDTLILMDTSDPALRRERGDLRDELEIIQERIVVYQGQRMQALSREALVGYERLCIAESQAVQRKRDIDMQIAPLRAQLQKLAEASAAHLAQIDTLSSRRIHFGAEYPEAVRASLTTLAKKEIEYRHGLANEEEIESARRQAAPLPYKGAE